MARALADAGVPTTAIRYDGMVHSMLAFSAALPAADDAFGRIRDALADAFGQPR